MHDLTSAHLDHEPQCEDGPSGDLVYETRMAWIASLWALLALLATAVALWDGWHGVP